MKLLKKYFDLQQQIHDYFGYKEDWQVIPLADSTDCFWKLNANAVTFADKKEDIDGEDGNDYQDELYTGMFLPKSVYRGEEYTMIVVDTHTDGNKFLRIFANEKEVK